MERLHLAAVRSELGARPHPLRDLYRAYLRQSHVFVGIYHQRYGWVAPGESVSGLEDEFRLSVGMPRLLYLKKPADRIEPRLQAMLDEVSFQSSVSYRHFTDGPSWADWSRPISPPCSASGSWLRRRRARTWPPAGRRPGPRRCRCR